jgi:hypothetical protein
VTVLAFVSPKRGCFTTWPNFAVGGGGSGVATHARCHNLLAEINGPILSFSWVPGGRAMISASLSLPSKITMIAKQKGLHTEDGAAPF